MINQAVVKNQVSFASEHQWVLMIAMSYDIFYDKLCVRTDILVIVTYM